jgi:hypothetical protein
MMQAAAMTAAMTARCILIVASLNCFDPATWMRRLFNYFSVVAPLSHIAGRLPKLLPKLPLTAQRPVS